MSKLLCIYKLFFRNIRSWLLHYHFLILNNNCQKQTPGGVCRTDVCQKGEKDPTAGNFSPEHLLYRAHRGDCFWTTSSLYCSCQINLRFFFEKKTKTLFSMCMLFLLMFSWQRWTILFIFIYKILIQFDTP